MDRIHIDDLIVHGVHGHYEHEWEQPQRFNISLSVGIDAADASLHDALAETIDYDMLRSIVEAVFASSRTALIEALAERIATDILSDVRAHDVCVSVRKLDAWDNGVPGVTITRARR